MTKTTREIVQEMCVHGEVDYLAPGEMFFTKTKAAHLAVGQLLGIKWLPWSGDPLAQHTFQIADRRPDLSDPKDNPALAEAEADAIRRPVTPEDQVAFGAAFDAELGLKSVDTCCTGEQKAEQPMASTSTDFELGMKTMRELCQYAGSDEIRFEAAKHLLSSW